MTWQPWTRAWQQALYGREGFYRRSSPSEHFATSAQGIPGAGPLLASAVARLARQHGLEQIIDVGAGRGELLRELARHDPGLTLTGTDVVHRPADLPGSISWIQGPGGALLADGITAVEQVLVIAHEWLDVVPCPVVEFDGRSWRLLEVTPAGDERLAGELDDAGRAWCQEYSFPDPHEGDRLEIGSPRDAAYAQLCSRVRQGLVVAVDYGYRSGMQPRHGTLTGYRDGLQCLPTPDGTCDITAHVCIDSLGADSAMPQRELLDRLGAGMPAPPLTLASTDPPAYLQRLATRSAWSALRAAGGLGDFWWVIRTIDIG
ncbi:SAM-dependent methyltransferase [Leekyejoonella antrihumi]|nr:SAM-dependent methyltransferase [Leekyejoonella antrihumi]